MRGGISAIFSNLRFETIGSISAIIVSVAAIIVAWDQAMVMRAQQHAAVWPILDVYFTTDFDEDRLYHQLFFENAGVGPAVIQTTRVYLGEQRLTHYSELGDYFPAQLHNGVNTSGGGFSRALGPERQDIILQFDWVRSPENDLAFDEMRDRHISAIPPVLVAEVCYCSVFDRCWVAATDTGGPPRQVRRCDVDEWDAINFLAEIFEAEANAEPATLPGDPIAPQGNTTTDAAVLPGAKQ